MAAATTRTRRARPKAKPVEQDVEELDLDDVTIADEEEEAPKPKRRVPAKKKPAAKKAPKVVEPDDDEDDDEDEEVEEKPKAKRQPPKRPEIKYSTAWLIEEIERKTGKSLKPFDLRALLRKMAHAGKIDRAVGTERGRYSFDGPKDPEVLAVIAAVKAGGVEKAKKASLDALKSKTAKKKAAAKKAKDEDVDEEDEVEDDFDELEDDEDDE